MSATTLELYPSMYPIGHKPLLGGTEGFCRTQGFMGKTPVWFAWVLAVVLLICAGISYRVMASRLELIVDTPVKLPVPLEALPERIGSWSGEDVPIPPNIVRVAGNDAYLNRLYVNNLSNQWANVYIAYTAHPRTMLGHRPQICYVAGGWIHDDTERNQITSRRGMELPCLIHRFHRPAPGREDVVVLNFYIVNGRITSDERVFSGVGWRTPNIEGDPARYVAQVQVSSRLENSVRAAAK
ncbi:MAG: exosortase-associated EpsI family protein, partial [Planctomycetota bacterium]